MNINGNLKFLGLGQVENLRVENLAVDPVAPSNGQVWYNTADQVYRGFNGTDVITFATGGNTAVMQAEIDTIENAVGLNEDGSFKAFEGTNFLNDADTLADAAVALDSGIKATADAATQAVADEATRATTADAVVQAAVDKEVADRTAADAVVQAAVDAEAARALAAEGVVQAAVDAEVTRATTAEGQLTSDLSAEVARAKAAEAALQDAIGHAGSSGSDEATRAQAAEATLQGNIDAEATRATDAEAALSDRVTTEVADRTAADKALADALAQELDLRFTADKTLQENIDAEATARAAADTALSNKLDSAIAGLTWLNAVDFLVADVTAVDLTGVADGTRYADEATHKIFTVTAGALDAGVDLAKDSAFFDKESDVPYVFNGTLITQFNGASGITAGTGLVKDGNTLNIVSTSGTITVTEDSIDVAQSVLDSITQVASNLAGEVLVARANEAGIDQRITDEIAARQAADTAATAAYEAAIDVEKTRALAAEAALQDAIDHAGSTGSDEATRAQAAEKVLTDALAAEVTRATDAEKAVSDALAAEVTRATTAEQGAADAVAAEATRATTAEGVLTDAVAAEVTRATTAEGVLTDALAAEVTRATDAETAINGRIEGSFFVYEGSVAAPSHTVVHGIGSKYNNVTVVDADDEVVIPQSIKFTDGNSLTVTFNTSITCKVIVSGLKPLVG